MKKEQKRTGICRKGQSIVEYMILMAAVIVVLLIFFGPGSGPFSRAFMNVIGQQGYDMLNAARTIF